MKQSAAAGGDAQAILQARARVLARRQEPPAERAAFHLLEFRLARERYALEMRHVTGVVPLGDLAPVPCTPPFVAGVVNVRGRITTVIDMQKLHALPARGLTDLHHIVLVRVAEQELGLLADAIVGVRTAGELQPPLPTPAGLPAAHLKGITADRIVVLDLERMLADPRINVQEEVDP